MAFTFIGSEPAAVIVLLTCVAPGLDAVALSDVLLPVTLIPASVVPCVDAYTMELVISPKPTEDALFLSFFVPNLLSIAVAPIILRVLASERLLVFRPFLQIAPLKVLSVEVTFVVWTFALGHVHWLDLKEVDCVHTFSRSTLGSRQQVVGVLNLIIELLSLILIITFSIFKLVQMFVRH